MTGEERREARRLRKAERREARAQIKKDRQASRLARQEGRQGFLSNMVGDGGLTGLIGSAGDAFGGGGGDDLGTGSKSANPGSGGGGNGDDKPPFDIMKMLPLLAIGAFFMLKKK
jgi:hypothetical protein